MAEIQPQVHGGGVSVVRGLGAVHVVVGVAVLVFARLVAHNLQGTVGDYLVGVHVHRRTGTALNHVGEEMFVMLAADDFLAGLHDGIQLFLIDTFGVDLVVGDGGAPFRIGETYDEVGETVHRHIADVEVVDTSQRLNPVQSGLRHLNIAQKVLFDTIAGLSLGSRFGRSFSRRFRRGFLGGRLRRGRFLGGRFRSRFLGGFCCHLYFRFTIFIPLKNLYPNALTVRFSVLFPSPAAFRFQAKP